MNKEMYCYFRDLVKMKCLVFSKLFKYCHVSSVSVSMERDFNCAYFKGTMSQRLKFTEECYPYKNRVAIV